MTTNATRLRMSSQGLPFTAMTNPMPTIAAMINQTIIALIKPMAGDSRGSSRHFKHGKGRMETASDGDGREA
jgi:hypothetical protein